MYLREWREIDLTKLPAARNASDRPAGPALYKEFYEALQAREKHPDPKWAHNKVRLGEFISTEILDRWHQQHGRSPRILALAVGQGFSEGIWLEQGWHVTLQEVQEVSLGQLHAKFPNAPTVIGDLRQLGDIGKYDIVAILASEYVLSREELKSVFQRVRTWLTKEGRLLVNSVTVLSLRQWAVEMFKVLSGRHRRTPHVFWGWWRTPGEFRQIASEAGLKLISVYRESSNGRTNPMMKLRNRAFQSWPLLRNSSLIMLFQVDGSNGADSREIVRSVPSRIRQVPTEISKMTRLKKQSAQPHRLRLALAVLFALVFVLVGPFWTSRPLSALAPSMVKLNPGEDLQAAVDKNPEGTIFLLGAGIHRLQSIAPKSRDVFRGEVGTNGQRLTILSGARLLTSFVREGRYWVAAGQKQHGQVHGECMPTYPRCGNPEDFFFDDRPFTHVARLRDLGPGKYFFDYTRQKIYFADDPAGHKLETSVTRSAFNGRASGIMVQDLVVEKYAVPDQMGAVGDQHPGTGWTVKNNEVRWNHGAGIFASTGARVLNNYIHGNGQLGIGGEGDDILVEGNEIAYNPDYSGTECGWECGGLKFSLTSRLTVRANRIHHNAGPGLWTDGDCINTLYEKNTVVENEQGIFHEISYRATIRNNTVLRNGSSSERDSWLWYGQIQISTSQDVEIYGNTVEVNSGNNGNGIVLIQQDRAEGGSYGPHQTVNNYVHDNTIIVTGTRNHGATGAAQDNDHPDIFAPSSRNRFDRNRYYVYDTHRTAYWAWDNKDLNWYSFRARGQEAHGIASSMPMLRSPIGIPKTPAGDSGRPR